MPENLRYAPCYSMLFYAFLNMFMRHLFIPIATGIGHSHRQSEVTVFYAMTCLSYDLYSNRLPARARYFEVFLP